jgi:hypothetical protein
LLRIVHELLIFLSRVKARLKRGLLFRCGFSISRTNSVFLSEITPETPFQLIGEYSRNEYREIKHSRSALLENHAYMSRQLVEIQDVVLDSFTGLVHSKEGVMLEESSTWPAGHLILSSVPKPARFLGLIPKIDARAVTCLPSNGYYHWLIEDLAPFIFSYQQNSEALVVISSEAPKYVSSFLEYAGIEFQIVPRFLFVTKLLLTTKGPDTGWPHPKDLELLRAFFVQELRPREPGRRIYISRLRSSRSPAFESELVDLLMANNWTILETESMPLEDQIHYLSAASSIAGVHGAGLSGMIWMQPGSKVIELGPNRYIPCFTRLASLCNHQFLRIPYDDLGLTNARDVFELLNKS